MEKSAEAPHLHVVKAAFPACFTSHRRWGLRSCRAAPALPPQLPLKALLVPAIPVHHGCQQAQHAQHGALLLQRALRTAAVVLAATAAASALAACSCAYTTYPHLFIKFERRWGIWWAREGQTAIWGCGGMAKAAQHPQRSGLWVGQAVQCLQGEADHTYTFRASRLQSRWQKWPSCSIFNGSRSQ